MKSVHIVLFAAAVAGHALAATPSAKPEPGSTAYQIDSAHDGAITFSKPFAPPLKPVWSIDLGGAVSYPVVAGNLVFVIADGKIGTRLFALDSLTGKAVWQKLVNGSAATSFLAVDGGTLFLITEDGPLQAYMPTTGKLLWVTSLNQAVPPGEYFFNAVPAATGGVVYVAGSATGGVIYAVNEKTGRLQWAKETFDPGGAVTVGDSYVYFPFHGDVPALASATGRVAWQFHGGGDGGVPAFFKGRLYISYGALEAGFILDGASGRNLGALSSSSPAFGKNAYYGIANDTLIATSIGLGNFLWSFPITEPVTLPSLVVNANVYTLSSTGMLYINSGGSGALLQSFNIGLGGASTQNNAPSSGLGAGNGLLFVPSGTTFSAYGPKK